ncbi:hypothetical protein M7I_2553 [Glarea lozoyensis 74030]|uniref:Uncharacterized protein n=1 Tax=Glarea lozoyensis (strain ATCC 74030 / MF5533) TaxID=1104152 RepID=H0EJ30_GLAL7|nr:hypothetical protein M7I_2553 [Glarea lozoyensis 74030]
MGETIGSPDKKNLQVRKVIIVSGREAATKYQDDAQQPRVFRGTNQNNRHS